MAKSRRKSFDTRNRGVVFDLDGTLFKNSIHYWVLAAKQTVAEYDLVVPTWAIQRILSHDPMRISEFGLPKSQAHEFRNQYRQNAKKQLETALPIDLKLLHTALQRLKDADVQTAIATSAPKFWMIAAMAFLQIEPFIDFSISRDDVDDNTAKPHPRQLQLALEKFQIPAHHAAMVGDTYSDLRAGFRANFGKNILVGYPGNEKYFPWRSVRKHKRLYSHLVFGLSHAVDVVLGVESR